MAIKGYTRDEYGRVTCPTDICHAVCCMIDSFRPDKPGPCEYLKDRQCELHKVGGENAKPMGCVLFPKAQQNIDYVNNKAKMMGLPYRCQLVVE